MSKKFVSQENLQLFAAKVKAEISRQVATIPSVSGALDEAKGYTDTKIAALVGGAPETLDTLNEIALALGKDENLSATLTEAIGKKADASAVETIGQQVTANTTALGDKADKSTVTTLSGTVATHTGNIAENATAIKAIKDDYFNSTNLSEMSEAEVTALCTAAFE